MLPSLSRGRAVTLYFLADQFRPGVAGLAAFQISKRRIKRKLLQLKRKATNAYPVFGPDQAFVALFLADVAFR